LFDQHLERARRIGAGSLDRRDGGRRIRLSAILGAPMDHVPEDETRDGEPQDAEDDDFLGSTHDPTMRSA